MILPQIIMLIIFILSYILIFSGKFERTTAALCGLFAMVVVGYTLGFTNFEKILGYVDWEVIILLFGMMTYVGLMAKTGFFKYLGVKAVKFSKGKPWLIFAYLSLMTAFISMVIDNVTTILLIIPLTIEITELLEINPIPIIVSEAVLSNIGGVGTMIGDPPNIMIGIASGYSFNDFIIHLFPPVILSMLLSIFIGRGIYRKWVRQEGKNIEKLMEINPEKYIVDRKKMNYFIGLLLGMIIFFFLGAFIGIPTAFVALAGGILALVVSMEDPVEAFKSVEWSTLVFFIALFALVGGLAETGLLTNFALFLTSLHESVVIISLIILWLSALLSSVVDHIPITAALIPVISIMSISYNTNLLWWALAIGVGVGGNLTYIGSSAGVVTVSLSKKYGYEVSNKEWFKFGVPVGILSLVVCSLYIMVIQI
jgi:Na+/H+ antiporter NhaD/arsenite permease-like protein